MAPRRKKTTGKTGLKQTALRAMLAEQSRDACRLKSAGLGYQAIADKLGCSLGKAYNLVQSGLKAYQADAKEETATWVTDAIARLLQSAQEAWIQWERSKQDRVLSRTKTTDEGTETSVEIEPQCAGAQYMEIFRKCMDQIAKLRGVYTKKFDIKSIVTDEDTVRAERRRLQDDFAGMIATTWVAPPGDPSPQVPSLLPSSSPTGRAKDKPTVPAP